VPYRSLRAAWFIHDGRRKKKINITNEIYYNDDKMIKEKEANGVPKKSAMEILMEHSDELSLLRENLTQKFLKRGEPLDTFEMIKGLVRLEILLEDKKAEMMGFSPALSARLENTLPPINYLVKRSKGMVCTVNMASVAFKFHEELYKVHYLF
jgi:hypothetical protein